MYMTSVNKVEEVELNREGAQGVKVKYLLHEDVGAKKVQLRLFTIKIGGYTGLEKHEHEHEIFILQGKALVKGGNTKTVVEEGDVIFIQSWEEHQFRNIGKTEVHFLCTKEALE